MLDDSSVFISYAHLDSDIDRVAGFTQLLHGCLPAKIKLLLDRKFLGIGKNVPDYMNRLETCPVVILLLTPEYKRKAEQATGGVFSEYTIVRKRYNDEDDDFLVLPVLFEGRSETSIPEIFIDEIYEDFRNFHPRINVSQVNKYYLSDKSREEIIPRFTDIAKAIESRIKVRSSIPPDVFHDNLERLFAKTKITRGTIHLYPEFLNHLFVPTHSYNRVKSQNAVFIIGRKGSGKSTVANILPELEHNKYKTCIPIIADHINLLATYEFIDQTRLNSTYNELMQRLEGRSREFTKLNPTQILFKYSWIGLLYICLAKELSSLGSKDKLNAEQLRYFNVLEDKFNEFTFRQAENVEASTFYTTASVAFAEFWDESVNNALNTTRFSDVIRYLDSNVNYEQYLRHLLGGDLLDALRNIVKYCDLRALVTLDDFDSVFSMFREGIRNSDAHIVIGNVSQSIEATWIQALMILILELKGYREGWRDNVFDKLDFCITIPRDSYLQVLYADRDAFFNLECTADLDWTGEYLAKMLLKRLSYMYIEEYDEEANVFVELQRVTRTFIKKLPSSLTFEFNSQRITIDLFCYVLRHTFWRPRDVLTYYAALLTASMSSHDQLPLTVEQVRRVISVTTKKILQFEFLGEFKETIGNLGKIINSFRRSAQILNYTDVYTIIKDIDFHIVAHGNISDYHDKLRVLYEIGFIGIKLPMHIVDEEGVSTSECFYFNEGSAVFDSMEEYSFDNCLFLIHPAFVEKLHLKYSENEFILNWNNDYLRSNHFVRVVAFDAM